MKKSLKITLMAICAAALVAVSVFGTLAYLTKTAEPVKNTFVNGKLLKGEFELWEHLAEPNNDGRYSLNSSAAPVKANEYTVLPGVPLPKDPYVTVDLADYISAYLFVEVIDNLPEGMDWTMDGANWVQLMDGENPVLNGKNEIWVYKVGEVTEGTPFEGKASGINIINGQTITVASTLDPESLTEGKTLEFNAYLCQATGFENALAAWNACFVVVPPDVETT